MATDATVPTNVTALEAALQPLIDEAEGLRADVHAAESARRLSAKYNLGMLALLVVLVVVLMAIGYQNNQFAKQVAKTNATLADCTVPGGACYNAANARTAVAIGELIRAEAVVSECARLYPGESGPAYDKKLEACVAERLAPPTPVPTPTPTRGR